MLRLRSLLTLALIACGCTGQPRIASSPDGDWPAYGRNGTATRFSPLLEIDRSNVARLQQAWVYHTGEILTDAMAEKSAFEATPIVVDGTMYFPTPSNRVIALDPANGKERWVFDPKVDRAADFSEVTSRGVSTWLDPKSDHARCWRRIYLGTIDARLIALDAASGQPCLDFGAAGTVDLTSGIRPLRRGQYQVTSPPAIIDDLVVIGSSIGDNGGAELERGVVRAFDARSGALRWSWNPIPIDGSIRSGAANAWAPIAVDEARHLLFVPTSSPSPDYFGGLRKGDDRDANSVVALRAGDGSRAWGFQVVHHDLWDYDVASEPLLIEVTIDGVSRAAVAIGTKMGHIFVVDRDHGQPLFPVEERAVPPSDVEGEEPSPTQPFPTFPAPLVPQHLQADQAWGPTAELRQLCHDKIASLRSEGIFTPPSLRGTLAVPGNAGGTNWGGLAYDEERKMIVTATNRIPFEVHLMPRADYDSRRHAENGESRLTGEFASMAGTPYGLYRAPLLSPAGTPCSAPPWGTLSAVDLAHRRLAWEVPLGFIPRMSSIPGYEGFGSFNLGGAMIAGGVVFIAAAMDPHLRGFDVETGQQLWIVDLPATAQATPMSYSAGGKQFIAIAAGGHGKLHLPLSDTVVAFSLK